MPEKTVSTTSFAEKEKVDYKGKKLRIAMIGCGGISEIQLDVLKEMPDVEIVAGVDTRPERLKVMEEKYGVKQLYSDWKKMLKEVKPDAVAICTPNGLHAPRFASMPPTPAAHVITEKPMAMNSGRVPEDDRRAPKKAKKKLVVRLSVSASIPPRQFITRARDEGQFGNVMFVKCQALRRRGIPNWGVFGRKELQGGGPMIDIGVHVIEMAHYVMGSPKPVAAVGQHLDLHGQQALAGRVDVAELGLQDLHRRGPGHRADPLRQRRDPAHRSIVRARTSRRTSGTSRSWATRAARRGTRR